MAEEQTHQPARVITGNCPDCGLVVVLFNNYETWGLFHCKCGWAGATDEVVSYHRGSVIAPWRLEEAKRAWAEEGNVEATSDD